MSRHDTLNLVTPKGAWHDLATAVDKARAGSLRVVVSKRAVDAILKDHSAMVRRLNECGIEARDPDEWSQPRARVEHVPGEADHFRVIIEEQADEEVTHKLVTEATDAV